MSEIDKYKQYVKEAFSEKLKNINKGYVEAKKEGDEKLCYAWETTFINILSLYCPEIIGSNIELFINCNDMEIMQDMQQFDKAGKQG